MLESLDSESQAGTPMEITPVLLQKLVERCHITLPDTPKPMSAIRYDGHLYAYVKFFPTVEAAQRGANRLRQRGNQVILTRIPKGLVLWVLELEAKIANKFPGEY